MKANRDVEPGQDKQKRLLETQDVGHFSMLRALHLADYITEMNGPSTFYFPPPGSPCSPGGGSVCAGGRLLRLHVHPDLDALRAAAAHDPLGPLARPGLPARRPLLRLPRRPRGALAAQVVAHGPGAGLARRPGEPFSAALRTLLL